MERFHLPKLIVEQGPAPGLEIELAKDEFVIGRIEGNDLMIPEPVLPTQPAKPANQTDQLAMAQYLQAPNDYQAKVDKIQADYKLQVNAYTARSNLYKTAMTAYQTKRTTWELDRNSAVSKAESIINTFNTNFGWAFVNKKNSAEYWSRILLDWGIVAGMAFILFVITLGFIYRKDRLK